MFGLLASVATTSLLLSSRAMAPRASLTVRPSSLPLHLRMMCAPAEAPPAAEEAAPVEIPPFGKLDIRVGKIVEAWPHPDSDKLWCEKIDVGTPVD